MKPIHSALKNKKKYKLFKVEDGKLTFVVKPNPPRYPKTATLKTTQTLNCLRFGNLSRIAVVTVSIKANCESRPSVSNIKKNRSDQRGDIGSLVTTSG